MGKVKLFALVGGSLLGISTLVAAGTYALFTSTTTNANNTLTAGTVHLTQSRDLGDSIPGPMFYSATSDPTGKYPYDTTKNAPDAPPGSESLGGWAPGDQATRAMNIFNDGSLDARVKQLKATVSGGLASGPAYDEFIDKMHVTVKYPAENKVIYDGNLAGLLNGFVNIPTFIVAASPSGPANITFDAKLDSSADNLVQGKTFVFDFTFYAEQKKNNP